ncbi:unnamed protein product, partial [Musa textilis]
MLYFFGGLAIQRRTVSSMGSYHLENNAPRREIWKLA